ncbi:MAG: TonB-dependent receptor [Steroidobacterales bacterium]
MNYDRKYLVWALAYAVVGMCVGIFMAASHDHGEFVTHAHILMIGFVLSLVYGIIHKLWLSQPKPLVARTQFVLHQAAAVTLSVGLWLLYGKFVPEAQLDPILGIAAITALVGALLMLYMVLATRPQRPAA